MNQKITGKQHRDQLFATKALVDLIYMFFSGLREAGMSGDQAYELTKLWFIASRFDDGEMDDGEPAP